MDCLGLSIALHRKANVKRRDRICIQITCVLRALQYVVSESPLHCIAFFPIVFHRHAGVLALGIQLGFRQVIPTENGMFSPGSNTRVQSPTFTWRAVLCPRKVAIGF